MKKTATLPPPTKGVKPRFDGVPGEIVSLEGLSLEFGKRARTSPYDPLLDALATATDEALAKNQPRPGLKFGDMRAKPSIAVRAKVKNMRVTFAESNGVLYVRLDGKLDDDIRESRRAAIRKLLDKGVTMTYLQIANQLRVAGDVSIDGGTVEVILRQMAKAGEVVKQEGGTWKLLKRVAA